MFRTHIKVQRMQAFYINTALRAVEKDTEFDEVKNKYRKTVYGDTRSVRLPPVQLCSGKTDTWSFEFSKDASGEDMYNFVRAMVPEVKQAEEYCVKTSDPFMACHIKRLIESRKILMDGQVYV